MDNSSTIMKGQGQIGVFEAASLAELPVGVWKQLDKSYKGRYPSQEDFYKRFMGIFKEEEPDYGIEF